MERGNHIRRGAAYGASLWLAYGVVECWMAGIVPWLQQPAYVYRPLHSGFTALLLLLYSLVGAAAGACAGLAIASREGDDTRMRAAAVMSLITAFGANALVLLPPGIAVATAVAGCAVVAVAAALVVVGMPRIRGLDVFLNPFCAALVIAGVPWIGKDILPLSARPIKLAAFVAWCVAVSVVTSIVRRDRPRFVAVAGVAVATLFLTMSLQSGPRIDPASRAAAAPGAGPSVVLITMDTVRADHLSVYGYKADTAPALSALARQATLYTHAMSASDTTFASHASMFTGLYPSQHGAHNDHRQLQARPLDAGVPLLAERLGASGYRTAGVVANFGYLSARLGLGRGFQYYDQRVAVRFLLDSPLQNHFLRQGVQRVLQHVSGTELSEVAYRRAADINRDALPLLDEFKSGSRPFFLFVNYMDAHWPYRPPPPFDTKFGSTRARAMSKATYYRMADEVALGQRTLSATEQEELHAQYDGGIANIDHHIGELIDRLKRLELFDNTLIVVTADHGEAFGDHGTVEHGMSVYQDQIHVPLIVKYPRQQTARVVQDAVGGVDIMATVLDVTGQPIPARLAGHSLAPLTATASAGRTVFSESFPDSGRFYMNPRFRRVERAVVADGVKLIVSTSGKRELYDLDDPDDGRDLATEKAELAERLDRVVNEWLATVNKPDDQTPGIDPLTLQRLRSLGYLR